MDVWGSQGGVKREQDSAGAQEEEEEEYEVAESGKDALVVLIDVRKAMFAPYELAPDESSDRKKPVPATWFHAVVELVVKLMKAKVVANDSSLLSVVFFGSVRHRCAFTDFITLCGALY